MQSRNIFITNESGDRIIVYLSRDIAIWQLSLFVVQIQSMHRWGRTKMITGTTGRSYSHEIARCSSLSLSKAFLAAMSKEGLPVIRCLHMHSGWTWCYGTWSSFFKDVSDMRQPTQKFASPHHIHFFLHKIHLRGCCVHVAENPAFAIILISIHLSLIAHKTPKLPFPLNCYYLLCSEISKHKVLELLKGE